MIQSDRVDALDGSLGIGIGGQQDLARIGIKLHGLSQKLGPGHPGHTLIDQEKCQRVISAFEPLNGFERLYARAGFDDPVFAAVVLSQVALDRIQYLRFVVDGQDDGFGQVFNFPVLGAILIERAG